MSPMKRADLASCVLLVLGILGLVFAARSAQPLVVTAEDCVEFWNATPLNSDASPVEAELWLFAEGEQDLGYGLCSVSWTTADGKCQRVTSPVWEDTTAWTREPARGCQASDRGTPVTLLDDGHLATLG